MSSALDMSLDDLIKNNKKSGGGGRGRGGGGGRSGPGPSRRLPNRSNNRSTPYSLGKPVQAPDSTWQHDLFTDPVAVAVAAQGGAGLRSSSAIETGTKLYISNLDYGVSNEDIKISQFLLIYGLGKLCFAKNYTILVFLKHWIFRAICEPMRRLMLMCIICHGLNIVHGTRGKDRNSILS